MYIPTSLSQIDWIYSSQQKNTHISRQWDYNKYYILYSNAKIYGSKCGELKKTYKTAREKKVGTLNESEIEWIIRCGIEFYYQEVMVGGYWPLKMPK